MNKQRDFEKIGASIEAYIQSCGIMPPPTTPEETWTAENFETGFKYASALAYVHARLALKASRESGEPLDFEVLQVCDQYGLLDECQ